MTDYTRTLVTQRLEWFIMVYSKGIECKMKSGILIRRKQSSRAPFITRRDTVKLKSVNSFPSCENKVAVPPSIPQLTTLKLEFNNVIGQMRKVDRIFCLDNGVH